MPKYFLELLYEFVLKYQNRAHTCEGDVVVQSYEDHFRCSLFSHASRIRLPNPGYPTGQLTAHFIPHKNYILQSVLNSVQEGITNKPYVQALKFPVRRNPQRQDSRVSTNLASHLTSASVLTTTVPRQQKTRDVSSIVRLFLPTKGMSARRPCCDIWALFVLTGE